MTKIDRRLNLVFPVQIDAGTVHVHVTPLHYDVFRKFYHPLAATYAQVLTPSGIGPFAGARVCALILENLAKAAGVWEGEDGVVMGLLPELRRLSNVVRKVGGKWEPQSLEEAIAANVFDAEEVDQIMSAIVFFMVGSAMLLKTDTAVMWAGLKMWDGASTSLNSTDWAASLPI